MAIVVPPLLLNVAGLFVAGFFGALVVVYLARDTAIPAFRSYMDSSELQRLQKERDEFAALAEAARKDRDRIQGKIERQELSGADAAGLLASHKEEFERLLQESNDRRDKLLRNQKGTAILGYAVYILLGGVFGVFFASFVSTPAFVVAGFTVNDGLEALAIGAAWPQYFAALRLNQRTPEIAKQNLETAEQFRRRVAELEDQISILLQEVAPAPKPTAAGGHQVPLQPDPERARAAIDSVAFELERTRQDFEERIRAQRIVTQSAVPKR